MDFKVVCWTLQPVIIRVFGVDSLKEMHMYSTATHIEKSDLAHIILVMASIGIITKRRILTILARVGCSHLHPFPSSWCCPNNVVNAEEELQ